MTDQLPVVEWNKLTPSPNYIEHAFSFGTSIWLLVLKNDGNKGMIEYDCITDTFNKVIPCPVLTGYINVCRYKDDTIVIEANHPGIITFNINTKLYSEPVKMPVSVGPGANLIAVNNYIHIFHGHHNPQRDGQGRYAPSKYMIFSINNRVVETFEDKSCTFTTIGVKAFSRNGVNDRRNKILIAGFGRICSGRDIAVVVVTMIFEYLKITEYYKFGGFDVYHPPNGRPLDWFFIGQLQDEHGAKPLLWTPSPKYSLKTRSDEPVTRTSYVFQNGVDTVILGIAWKYFRSDTGEISFAIGNYKISKLSIIDVNGDQETFQRSIKLPMSVDSVNAVIMDHQKKIHFFGMKKNETKPEENIWEHTHHEIPLQIIIDNAGSDCSR